MKSLECDGLSVLNPSWGVEAQNAEVNANTGGLAHGVLEGTED